MASIITADPAALSVAPVPACHESKCAPSITTSSARSVPGSSPSRVKLSSVLVVEAVLDVQLDLHRQLAGHQARDAVVVFGGHHDLRRDDRRVGVAIGRRCVGHEDGAVVVATGGRFERGHRAFLGQELHHALVEISVGRAARAAPASAPGVDRLRFEVRQLLGGEPPAQRREQGADLQ